MGGHGAVRQVARGLADANKLYGLDGSSVAMALRTRMNSARFPKTQRLSANENATVVQSVMNIMWM